MEKFCIVFYVEVLRLPCVLSPRHTEITPSPLLDATAIGEAYLKVVQGCLTSIELDRMHTTRGSGLDLLH